MFIIQAKIKDQIFYIEKESLRVFKNKIGFCKNINEAQTYNSKYEFLVALKIFNKKENWNKIYSEEMTFFLIDTRTLKKTKFDLNEKVSFKKKKLIFSKSEFMKMIDCYYNSSRYCYDKKGKWISFIERKDHKNIKSIDYLKRGLVSGIESHFKYRNKKEYQRDFFKDREFMLKDERLCKIYLDESIDEVDRFKVVYK